MSFSIGSRERIRQIAESGTPGNQVPHIALSPRTSSGVLTGSVGIVLFCDLDDFEEPIAVANAGGITLTIYRSIPTLGNQWSKLVALTGIAFNDQLVLPDIGGGWELYLVATNITVGASHIYAAIVELP